MWISRCITRKSRKSDKNRCGYIWGKTLWISVDNVDVHKIEHTFCARCLVYHNMGGNVNFL